MPNASTSTKATPQRKKAGKQKGKTLGRASQVIIPAAVGSKTSSKGPRMRGSPTAFVVSNTELVEMLPMVSATDLKSGLWAYSINPGIQLTFPWLAAIALNFQSYRFRKLRFVYHPACSSTANGMMTLAIDTDPSNDPPGNIQALSAFRHRVSGQPWGSLSLDVPMSALGALSSRKLIRSAGTRVVASQTPSFDVGNFYAYAGHGTDLPLCGTLEVSYTVELIEPQPPERGDSALCTFKTATPLSLVFPFGLVPVRTGSLAVEGYTSATETYFIAPSPGTYSISLVLTGTGFAETSYTLTGIGSTAFNLPQSYMAKAAGTSFALDVVFSTTDTSSGVYLTKVSGTTITSAWCLITTAPLSVLSL